MHTRFPTRGFRVSATVSSMKKDVEEQLARCAEIFLGLAGLIEATSHYLRHQTQEVSQTRDYVERGVFQCVPSNGISLDGCRRLSSSCDTSCSRKSMIAILGPSDVGFVRPFPPIPRPRLVHVVYSITTIDGPASQRYRCRFVECTSPSKCICKIRALR